VRKPGDLTIDSDKTKQQLLRGPIFPIVGFSFLTIAAALPHNKIKHLFLSFF